MRAKNDEATDFWRSVKSISFALTPLHAAEVVEGAERVWACLEEGDKGIGKESVAEQRG